MPQKESSKGPIRFTGPLQRVGTRCIVRLPKAASLALPSRGQVAVHGTLNDHAFETVVEPDGLRGHWISIDDALGRALGLENADEVTAVLEPSKAWPEPQLPKDLGAALDDAPDLAETWPSLTPMARWEWVRWVSATRNPETRQRRVEVAISKMRDGKRRPCCFDLASCTDPELSRGGKLKVTDDA